MLSVKAGMCWVMASVLDQIPVPSSPVMSWTTLSRTSEMTRGWLEEEGWEEDVVEGSRLWERSAPMETRKVPRWGG